MQTISARPTTVPAAGRLRRRTLAVAGATSTLILASAALAAGAWAEAGAGSTTNVQGSQSAGHWPLIQTLGIFAGIPLALAVLIVILVMAGPTMRAGRDSIGTEAFSGPHAGPVDAAPDARVGAGAVGRVGAEESTQGGAGARW